MGMHEMCKRGKVEDDAVPLLEWLSTYIECWWKNCSTWGSNSLMEEGSYCTTTCNYICIKDK